jgi:hypothetical protein
VTCSPRLKGGGRSGGSALSVQTGAREGVRAPFGWPWHDHSPPLLALEVLQGWRARVWHAAIGGLRGALHVRPHARSMVARMGAWHGL